jgi:hypothetical protein
MARPQEQQVTQRRAISTLEDQQKYEMPSGRRLRVVADPLRMNVEAEVPSSVRLAQALAEVKPTIMAGLADEASTQNANEVNLGILERTQGLPPDEARSEWRQYGYEHQSAYLKGEDLGAKLEADIQSKDPNVSFEQWYQEWWQTNAQEGIPTKPEQSITFNKSFTKSLVKARDFDTKNVLTLKKEQQASVATENMFRAISDIRRKRLPITTADWNALKTDISKGFSNPETDELFYNALERYAEENNDVDALNVLYEKRGDVPALVNNPKYTQKIVDLRQRVLGKYVAEHKATEKAKEDAIKTATEEFEQGIRFKFMGLSNIEDPVTRSAMLTEIQKEVQEAGSKYTFSAGFLNTLESRIVRADKGEATAFQEQSYRTLYTGNASQSQIDKAIAEGSITQAQWDRLVSKKQQEADRAKRLAEKGEKPISKNQAFKDAEKAIKIRAGYNPMNMTPDSKETLVNGGMALERYRELVEEKIDSGLDAKSAIKEATTETFQFMTDTGLMSKDAIKVEKRIDGTDREGQLKRDPVGYYTRNPEVFLQDYKAKTIPANLSPEQRGYLQRKALQKLRDDAVKAKKPTNKSKETKVN